MNEPIRDPLDEVLDRLPREVRPGRDLWSDIRASIDAQTVHQLPVRKRRRFELTWYQMAAGVLLVLTSSVTTYVLTRTPEAEQSAVASNELPVPALSAMPANFAGQSLGADYASARAGLDELFQQRLAALPLAAREKIERNLADLRLAANEISATLAQHPSDPLLQELLMSTYQSELRLLTDVSQMAPTSAARADL
jgi:hypothetical protein